MTRNNNTKGAIHNPHDKALFKALENHEVARDAMRAYLPKSLLSLTTLKIIRQHKTRFITPQYKEFEADIMYEIELEDTSALILFHCEQQSTVDKIMPLRIWQYLLLVLMEYAKNHEHRPLPITYPIILYTGENYYTESTNLFDLFGKYKGLSKKYLLNEIHLVDVCRMSDNDIKKHKYFGLSEYAFKHKQSCHFEKTIEEMMKWAHQIEYKIGREYAKMVLKYVIEVYPEADYEVLNTQAKRHLSEELGDETMTIAQQLRREGIQQGMQQGMQQGLQIVARRMLENGLSLQCVAENTGLSLHELSLLKKDLVNN